MKTKSLIQSVISFQWYYLVKSCDLLNLNHSHKNTCGNPDKKGIVVSTVKFL